MPFTRNVRRRVFVVTLLAVLVSACNSNPPEASVAPIALRSSPPTESWAAREAVAPDTTELLRDPGALLRRLVEQNAEVAAAGARIRQLEAAFDQARLWPDPSLDLDVGGIQVGRPNPSDLPRSDSLNASTTLHEKIEIGKRAPRIEAAQVRVQAERSRYASLIGEKARQAREALAREVYLRAKIAVTVENVDSARQMLDLERRRMEQGDMSGNDFDRLSLDTLLLELDLPRLRADHEAAVADVHAALGPGTSPAESGVDVLAAAAPAPDAPEVESAIEGRADHAAISLEMQAASSDARLARRRAIPDPMVGVGYVHDRLTEAGNQPDTMELSVGIDLPLFDRGQHESRRAEERRAELAETLRESVREAEADATELLEKRRALTGILDRLDHEAIPKSSQVLGASTEAYHRGQLSLTDVLLARRTHADLVLKEMDLQFESFGVRNDLRRVLGMDAALARDLFQESRP